MVEDAPLMGALIEAFLVAEGFEVRVCTEAESARTVASQFDPDLAILDVNLGDGITGVQLGFILERTHPAMAIMYLTQYPSAFLSQPGGAAHVGSKVILNKESVQSPKDFLHAVEAALRGFTSDASTLSDERLQSLSTLQWEILRMVSAGLTNAAIAQRRGTSERAVEKHLQSIYEALEIDGNDHINVRVLAARRYLEATGVAVPDPSEI